MHRIGGLVTQPQNIDVCSCSHLDRKMDHKMDHNMDYNMDHKMNHNMDHSLNRNLDHRLTHDFSSQMGHQQHPKHDMPQPPTCDPPLLGQPNNCSDNKDASRQLTPSIPQESHGDHKLAAVAYHALDVVDVPFVMRSHVSVCDPSRDPNCDPCCDPNCGPCCDPFCDPNVNMNEHYYFVAV